MRCKNCDTTLECPQCHNRRSAGSKGVDILAIDQHEVCWLIEIKDYRETLVSDFGFLADVVAIKIRDTLACLAAARVSASEPIERDSAERASRCLRFGIVLHLEIPSRGKLNPSKLLLLKLQERMRQLLKGIDPNLTVVDREDLRGLDWTVTDRSDSPTAGRRGSKKRES